MLPTYNAVIDSSIDNGMFVISLVESPAVEVDFLKFGKQYAQLKYSITDKEEQKVFGVVMTADKPIYRKGENGEEYYIVFSKETISKMAEKYFKNNYQNNVDTEHNMILEEGITLTQMFIKDKGKGINPKGFEDVADGSLFAEFHITNGEIWDAVKNGEYKGFSLAGTFILEQQQFAKVSISDEEKHFEDIMDMINKIEKKYKK